MDKRAEFNAKAEQRIFNFMGLAYPYNRPKSEWTSKTIPEKILVLSDPHEPYGNRDVYDAVERLHKDAGSAVVTGDLGDYYSKSRFRKTRHQRFDQELRSVFFRMEWLATHWKHVEILSGNHDCRPEKTIQNMIDGQTDLIILTEQNILEHLASYFDNVSIVGTQINLLGIDEMVSTTLTHIYQRGDIVFTHGERNNVLDDTLMRNISQWLRGWSTFLNLKPYRIIAQAHNHKDMKKTAGIEKWFLMPTCSTPKSVGMEYILAPRMYGYPPAVGYSLFYQSNGETDYNNSGNILL